MIEAYDANERFITQGQPSEERTLEILVPTAVSRVTLKGWAQDRSVARRVVATT